MFNLNNNEIENIDKRLNPKIQWAEQNGVLAEQLAMDATRLLSCTSERFEEYKNKGFFNRCVSSFSGETADMQRQNQNDLIELQKAGWRYLQLLNERDILMAHSLITIKNNLETLAIEDTKTREEITRLAIKVKQRFDGLSKRVDDLEVTVNLLHWLSTIEVQDYEDNYSYYFRLLCLVDDFKSKKTDNWNYKDIQCLQQAILKAKINRKERITINNFIIRLIDEIEEQSFPLFNGLIKAFIDNKKISSEWIDENISSPVFNCLYLIAAKYNDSKSFAKGNQENLKEGTTHKEIITSGIIQIIKDVGVDTDKELQLQDVALEILSCSQLTKTLISNSDELIEDDISENQGNLLKLLEPQNEILTDDNISENLQLSLIPKLFVTGENFTVFIDSYNKVKTFGSNNEYMGIGTKENSSGKVEEVIDLPSNLKCISISTGKYHSLALFENGDIYSWGGYKYGSDCGELGCNTKEPKLSGFKVIGLPKNIKPVKIVASANSSMVLLENGDLYGAGKITNSLIFVPYELNFKVKDFDIFYDSNDNAIVLINKENDVLIKNITHNSYAEEFKWCKYEENGFFIPTGLPEDVEIMKIMAGSCYLYVLTSENTLYSIGDNRSGQLGINDYKNQKNSFSKIYDLKGKVLQLTTNHDTYSSYSENHFVIIQTSACVYGCGVNEHYQLGAQQNFRIEKGESGLIFKDKYETKYYFEKKPKIISELNNYVNGGGTFEISCDSYTTYLYSLSEQKIHSLGNNEAHVVSKRL
ncbi:MAG: hypothetical protein PHD79_11310 [Aliarcobacter sp.]|nr:hypothetical protein [Aliarcobacter sp.]